MTRKNFESIDQGFGAKLAEALVTVATAAETTREQTRAAFAHLVERAAADGPAFIAGVEAAARGIASGFNGALGEARLAVRSDGHTVAIADDRFSSSVAVVGVFPTSVEAGTEPHLTVDTRDGGAGGRLIWALVANGGALLARRGAFDEPMSPEAFAREVLTPWLQRRPMAHIELVASIPSALPRAPR